MLYSDVKGIYKFYMEACSWAIIEVTVLTVCFHYSVDCS